MRRFSGSRLLVLVLAAILGLACLAGVAGCDRGDESASDDPSTETVVDQSDSDEGDPSPEETTGADEDDDDAETADGDDNDGAPSSLSVYLYFSYGGDRSLRVERTIGYTPAVGTAALEQLLAGPTEDELATWPLLATNIPEGTELQSLVIDDGIATVSLSEAFEGGGGTFSVTARLAEIVYTLCQFDSVDGVVFQIDGVTVEMFSGEGLMLDGPQTPEDYYSLVPVDA